jgi:hypothetical protein
MTQTRLWLLSLSLAAGMGALDAQPVAACSCVRSSPCQDFNASMIPSRSAGADLSRVVFVGKVLTVQRVGDVYEHRLRVLRPLKGITAPTADVSSDAVSSCFLKLTVGDRYVIYTWAANGKMHINQCSRIVRLAPGEPEPELPPVPGRVYGRVSRYDRVREGEPIPGVSLWLDLPSGRVSTRSDAWGRFTFANVPPGSHAVGVDAGRDLRPRTVEPIVIGARDCVDSYIFLQPPGAAFGADDRRREGGATLQARRP